MSYWYKQEEAERDEDGEVIIDPSKNYTPKQLDAIAEAMLKDWGKEELCRECLEETEEEVEGKETGHIEYLPQYEEGEPVLDNNGKQLTLASPEICCPDGHKWFRGEGKARGHRGKDPVLFEEHLIQRQRREIYCADGTPDPNIVSGIYNRSHPQGRRVNSDKARKEQGASYYA